MLRKNAPTLALAAAILLLIALFYRSEVGRGILNPPPAPPPTPTASLSLPAPQLAVANRQSPISASERSSLADTLNSPATTIQSDLRLVLEIVSTFRTNFPREGNPVGSNAEITATLTGQNKLHLALIPPDHPAINRATGELCDRWGTPFFFHAESGTRMTIQSAGPDKKLHTTDDVILSP